VRERARKGFPARPTGGVCRERVSSSPPGAPSLSVSLTRTHHTRERLRVHLLHKHQVPDVCLVVRPTVLTTVGRRGLGGLLRKILRPNVGNTGYPIFSPLPYESVDALV
jgi:hypothetical protein